MTLDETSKILIEYLGVAGDGSLEILGPYSEDYQMDQFVIHESCVAGIGFVRREFKEVEIIDSWEVTC